MNRIVRTADSLSYAWPALTRPDRTIGSVSATDGPSCNDSPPACSVNASTGGIAPVAIAMPTKQNVPSAPVTPHESAGCRWKNASCTVAPEERNAVSPTVPCSPTDAGSLVPRGGIVSELVYVSAPDVSLADADAGESHSTHPATGIVALTATPASSVRRRRRACVRIDR
jgi:hypothetical protein